jgi:hypothetical protein
LCRRTARTGIGHHIDGVERLLHHRLALFHARLAGNTVDHRLATQLLHHRLGDLVAGAAPDIYHLVVTFTVSHQAGSVLSVDFMHFLFCCADQVVLFRRHQHIVHTDRDTRAGRIGKAGIHQPISHDHRIAQSALAETGVDQARDLLLLERLVDQGKRQTCRQHLGQQGTAHRSFIANPLFHRLTGFVLVDLLETHHHFGLQLDFARLVSARHLGDIGEHRTLTQCADLLAGHVIQAQHDVLRRDDDRLTVRGRQHIVGSQHQGARFHLRLQRQRHVHRHLVAVEVGVECGTHQRMQLDRLAFDQQRFERLNAETVQGRCTIQQHRMFANHFFENIPYDRFFCFHHTLAGLDGSRQTHRFEPAENERLEQFQRHFLGQAALMQLQLRPHHDH